MCPAAENQWPNVIVILVDAMGWSEIGCYGGEILMEALHSRNPIRNAPPRLHRKRDSQTDPDNDPIITIVRETPMKILVCPEDSTQMETGRELLVDPLPDDVKQKVVWREKFWLTDEAISTYRRSAGLVSLEMHSPIMALGNGIPAIVCRFAEQTTKGFMWRNIGLGDWLFDLDKPEELARVVPTALAMAKDPAGAKAKAALARNYVQQRQRETMRILRDAVTAVA